MKLDEIVHIHSSDLENLDVKVPMPMRSRDEALGVAFQEAKPSIGVDGW